jgi:hypothetical protein
MPYAAQNIFADFATVHHDTTTFDNSPRKLEHAPTIRIGCVNRDIRIGTRAKVALVCHTQNAGRPRAADNCDFLKAILTVDVGKDAPFANTGMHTLQDFIPIVPIH